MALTTSKNKKVDFKREAAGFSPPIPGARQVKESRDFKITKEGLDDDENDLDRDNNFRGSSDFFIPEQVAAREAF